MTSKKFRILFALLLAFVGQVNCKATQRAYPAVMPTPVLAEVPTLLGRGEKGRFSVKAIPGAECHAGIGYYNLNDKWVWMELSTIESDKNGICEWMREIPEDAKDGLGEFRARIENNEESRNTFPATFCIGQCP